MHFKSKFVPVTPSSGKCSPSVQDGRGGNLGQGDSPVTPMAVQAMYQFSLTHTITTDKNENLPYSAAAEQCKTEPTCHGYTWPCNGDCHCIPPNMPCETKFPTSPVNFQFNHGQGEPDPSVNPTMNALVKKKEVRPGEATEAPITV